MRADRSLRDISKLTGAVRMASAIQLLEQLDSRSISAEQVTRETLQRCEALKTLNALITLRADEAVREARTIDAARTTGGRVGPLGGLPILVKDNIAVGGCRFTGGSPAFLEHVAERDSGVVARLRAAGAIVVGKTNLHEIAFGTTSNNAWFGPVHNPYDFSRICGGSSGGTAAG